jgi:conjugal transfer pilus assembly protein TraK
MAHQLLPRLLPLAALALASAPAAALQLVDARDGVAVEGTVSTKEATRIRIEGTPIADVFGNIHSSNCQGGPQTVASTPSPAASTINPSGEIVLECDRDKGEVYVRPVGNSTKPINLFISSATATYTLVLHRRNVPADTIVIRDKTPHQDKSGVNGSGQRPAARASDHIRSLKALLSAMASDQVPGDMRVEEVHAPKDLWNEARLTLMRVYEGRGLIGEKYLLTNVSDVQMVLAEQEFDRQDGNVAAIAIDNLNLRPGDSTNLYVIRMGN